MKKFTLAALVLVLLTSAAWWQQGTLLGWHYMQRLHQADEQDRQAWLTRLIELDVAIQGRALDCLRDDSRSELGQAILTGLARRWNEDDARGQRLANDLLEQWTTFRAAGKAAALETACALLNGPQKKDIGLAPQLLRWGAAELPGERATLRLASVLAERRTLEAGLARELAQAGLKSLDAEVRAQAVLLVLQPALNSDSQLQAQAAARLRDVSEQVRRAALLVVGAKPELVSDDDLLPLLHDADTEVVRLCEVALRSRGLQDEQLRLARLISAADPADRLQVVHFLTEGTDLDPGIWLRRLCRDASPAVRAGAIRTAALQPGGLVHDCLQELAENDPSPTVRQLAQFYLRPSRRVANE